MFALSYFFDIKSKDLSGELISGAETAAAGPPTHVFQALQYLKKVPKGFF